VLPKVKFGKNVIDYRGRKPSSYHFVHCYLINVWY